MYFLKFQTPNIVNEHFSLKAIEYVSHKLFLNYAQFGNVLKSLSSSICPKSIEICVKFCFCEVLLSISKCEFTIIPERFHFGFITKKFPAIFC